MVPEAEFQSYYGRPVVKETVWGPDIPSYLFLGGLAGASSTLAAGADLTGHAELARDREERAPLGRSACRWWRSCATSAAPARFVNMLRVLKVTSPMSVGTWIVSGYAPMALAAAASAVTHKLPRAGLAATLTAAALLVSGRSRLTPRFCWVTPPLPRGMRRTASCRSYSSGPQPRPPVASACWPSVQAQGWAGCPAGRARSHRPRSSPSV